MKVLKKSLSLLLCSLFMVAPLAACGDSADKGKDKDALQVGGGNVNDATDVEGNEITRPSYFQIPDEFRWVAYSTPPNEGVGMENTPYFDNPDYNTEANWQTMAECGFGYAQPIHYDITDEDKQTSLANAEKAGVKILLGNTDNQDSDSLGYLSSQGGTYQEARNKILNNQENIKAHYAKFTSYDSFAGIFGCDEPDATKFPAIAAAQDWFEDNYPEYEFYVNLLPEYASDEQLFGSLAGQPGYQTYDDYVARFCEIVNPYVVSYDHYCLMEDGSYLDGFFYNLAVGAQNAKALEDKYGWDVPFYIYLQTMGFEHKSQMLYSQQWSWQVYTSMAFGIMGVQTFNYWPHMATTGGGNAAITDAIVDRAGNKMDLYYWVQDTIADIKAMEDVYLSYNWEHAAGWTPNGKSRSGLLSELDGYETRSYMDIAEITTTQEILIGQFVGDEDATKHAYMVANASDVNGAAMSGYILDALDDPSIAAEVNATVTLKFASDVTSLTIYKPAKGCQPETVNLTNGATTFEIPVGDGFFIVANKA
ncbi:MAG: hypothetical protein E7355_02190 [Clostridiales bacterium]|nr:hypothetical protein [Clostridiales bacterium]